MDIQSQQQVDLMLLFMMAMMSRGSFTPTGAGEVKTTDTSTSTQLPLMFQALPSIVVHSGTTSQLSLPILMTARRYLLRISSVDQTQEPPLHSLSTRQRQAVLKVSVQRQRDQAHIVQLRVNWAYSLERQHLPFIMRRTNE